MPDKESADSSDTPEVFEIERIVADKWIKGEHLFRVKWVGYDEKDNTWEPMESFRFCPSVIDEYLAKKEEKKLPKINRKRTSTTSQETILDEKEGQTSRAGNKRRNSFKCDTNLNTPQTGNASQPAEQSARKRGRPSKDQKNQAKNASLDNATKFDPDDIPLSNIMELIKWSSSQSQQPKQDLQLYAMRKQLESYLTSPVEDIAHSIEEFSITNLHGF